MRSSDPELRHEGPALPSAAPPCTGHRKALPVERTPHLAYPVHPKVLLPQPFDLRPQLRVTPRSGQPASTTGLSRLESPASNAPIVLVRPRWGCYDRSMAEAIAFDTHRFVKRLTENGFTERQAETLAEEHVALLNANLATKADIAEVKAQIEAVKADLLKWLFGALIAQGGLIVALVKLL